MGVADRKRPGVDGRPPTAALPPIQLGSSFYEFPWSEKKARNVCSAAADKVSDVRLWVKLRRTQSEQISSGLPLDSGHSSGRARGCPRVNETSC
jgi:hypothetical protein